jgi:transaldolase
MMADKLSQLDQLKQLTTVVADTGDINNIKHYSPQDATTNPSLILKSALDPAYKSIFDKSVEEAKSHGDNLSDQLYWAHLHLAANFGCEILKYVPGRVSTEIDARLSFDTQKTIDEGRRLIDLYSQKGVDKSRVLLKIASTWEGIQAAKVLEAEGLNCNMTLIFHLSQAIACADVNATLISPFVGRITDWYKDNAGFDSTKEGAELNDPGVLSVQNIYNYFHHFGHKTIVMGASFRNIGQIQQLAGCDYLTISPQLLSMLQDNPDDLPATLSDSSAKSMNLEKIKLDEAAFRWSLNQDPMATDKLSDGIRRFAVDIEKLEDMLKIALG